MSTIVFAQSGVAVRVAQDLMTLLRTEAAAGYERMVWGGVELGGILLGERREDEILVQQRIACECEHAYGPAFELTPKDEERFAALLEKHAGEVVGWYRTTSRDLSLTQPDEELFNRRFPQTDSVALLIRRARDEAPRFAAIRRNESGTLSVIAEVENQVEAPSVPPEQPPVEPIRVRVVEEREPQPPPDAANVLELFGFRVAPFGQVADPEFFHPARPHRVALTKLHAGIEARKGFLLLSGEAGTGKTMVLRCLMQQLEKAGIAFSCLLNSRVTVEELFDWLALDMDLHCATRRKSDVWIALVERLSARRTALLVDDAHKLSAEVLEELELLGNLENRNGSLLQVVMAGNSMLDGTLDEYRHHGLKQRIAVRTKIAPLTLEETTEYIHKRTKAAGWTGGFLFGESVVERIWQRTGGVPRLINALCEAVLDTAFTEGQRELTEDLVDRTD